MVKNAIPARYLLKMANNTNAFQRKDAEAQEIQPRMDTDGHGYF
jgi:hypothetical protein